MECAIAPGDPVHCAQRRYNPLIPKEMSHAFQVGRDSVLSIELRQPCLCHQTACHLPHYQCLLWRCPVSIGTALIIIALGYLMIKYHRKITKRTLLKTLVLFVAGLVAILAILIPFSNWKGRKEVERIQHEQLQRMHQLAEEKRNTFETSISKVMGISLGNTKNEVSYLKGKSTNTSNNTWVYGTLQDDLVVRFDASNKVDRVIHLMSYPFGYVRNLLSEEAPSPGWTGNIPGPWDEFATSFPIPAPTTLPYGVTEEDFISKWCQPDSTYFANDYKHFRYTQYATKVDIVCRLGRVTGVAIYK